MADGDFRAEPHLERLRVVCDRCVDLLLKGFSAAKDERNGICAT
jgi:hypothetical protein